MNLDNRNSSLMQHIAERLSAAMQGVPCDTLRSPEDAAGTMQSNQY